MVVICNSEASAAVKALFGVGLVNRVYCAESSEETFENESVYALKCHISQDINHLHEGLRRGLKSELEKMSTSLGRSAVFSKESRISELPRYLTVQFVRFFWKRESNQKAKILRGSSNDSTEPSSMDLDKGDDTYQFRSKLLIFDVLMSTAVSSEEKEHLTGIYDLVAVLTHKGRSADSGHYVAWVKQENGLSSRLKRFLCMHFGHSFRLKTADDAGKWIQYDDDNPIPQREEDITKLSGGGKTLKRENY
ncbi:hypothetical protein GW17_00011045 [Ensete ventricosum]|nr:hypothetical protein GW17_00011045 [Ensete ventricosum]